jgi:uncharacterized heparinase superfamily protein
LFAAYRASWLVYWLEVELWLAEATDEEGDCHDLPDRVVLPYQEKPFGQFFMGDDGELALFAAGAAPSMPDSVVSLALFDGTHFTRSFA